MDRGIDRPCAVRIDSQRNRRPEFGSQGFDGFNFDERVEDTAFEFDFAKAILLDHLAAFANGSFRSKHLAVFIGIVTISASAGVLVEQISGERNRIANSAADHITNGPADGFTDDVETGNFEAAKVRLC